MFGEPSVYYYRELAVGVFIRKGQLKRPPGSLISFLAIHGMSFQVRIRSSFRWCCYLDSPGHGLDQTLLPC
jgi:hypothetical protein